MKLTFELHFTKKIGFSDEDFLKVISENLKELGLVNSMKYDTITEGYLFEIDFVPVLPGFTYQPILGCFSTLEVEYPYISNICIPLEKMRQ